MSENYCPEEPKETPGERMPENYCPEGCEQTTGMEEWITAKQEAGADMSCALPLVCGWYEDELQENDHAELAEELSQVRGKGEDNDPVEVCRKMDEIKTSVPENLRNRLFEFDCSTQLNAVEC